MRYDVQAVLMLIAAILGSVVVVTVALRLVSSDAFPVDDAVGILQGLATIAAIVLGAMFAYRNSLLFRPFEPHLTVTHALSHRRLGQSYVHIAVTVTLHNTSKVKVDIQDGYILLAQISPIDDETIEQEYTAASYHPGDGEAQDFQWPLLAISRQASSEGTLVIEPGEIYTELSEFIVSSDVETVLVYSYFYNSKYPDRTHSAPGWTASTVYDIVIDR